MADIVIKRTVPPEVYAIALVAEGKKVVGVRMVDVSLKLGAKGSLFDFPLGVVEKAAYARAGSCVKHDYAGRSYSRVSHCKL